MSQLRKIWWWVRIGKTTHTLVVFFFGRSIVANHSRLKSSPTGGLLFTCHLVICLSPREPFAAIVAGSVSRLGGGWRTRTIKKRRIVTRIRKGENKYLSIRVRLAPREYLSVATKSVVSPQVRQVLSSLPTIRNAFTRLFRRTWNVTLEKKFARYARQVAQQVFFFSRFAAGFSW